MHYMKVVSSTLHQMLKYPHKGGVATVFRNLSIHPLPEVPTPLLEINNGDKDVFLLGFALAKAQVLQIILDEDEGMHVSDQSIYFMNKLQHIPRIRAPKEREKRCCDAS